jgi:hypothetical protein
MSAFAAFPSTSISTSCIPFFCFLAFFLVTIINHSMTRGQLGSCFRILMLEVQASITMVSHHMHHHHQSSRINHQASIINHRSSIISISIINHQSSSSSSSSQMQW